MVKRKIILTFLFTLLFTLLGACSFNGPHKPISADMRSPAKGSGGNAPSFEDVKPLFSTYCHTCHSWQNDQAGAMAAAKAGTIQNLIHNKQMPKAPSKQADSITEEAREKIIAWADSVKNGNPGPPAPEASPIDTIRDRNLAFAFRCMRCHGPQGTSSMPDTPNLAGHDRGYIISRLQEFMTPDAHGTTMPGQMKVLANDFSLKDANDPATMELLSSVAAFYGTYDLSVSAEDLEQKRKALSQEQLAQYEEGKKLVADNACTSCHLQANLRPMADTPMIFAQKADYLLSRFNEFKAGKGGNVMPGILEAIPEGSLSAITLYLNLTHPSQYK